MLSWLKPQCPINPNEKAWVEFRVAWLLERFGFNRLKSMETVLPTADYFPLPYRKTDQDVQAVFDRVAGYMNVDPALFRLHIFDESSNPESMPPMEKTLSWKSGVAFPFYEGFYCEPNEAAQNTNADGPIATLHIRRTMLDDLELLIALFSREIAQYLLTEQGDGPTERNEFLHTMELMPLFFGLGIFGANAVIRERSEFSLGWEFWSMVPWGALPARYFGYALALMCWLREEPLPAWHRHLRRDAEDTLKASLKYLEKTGDTILSRDPLAKPYEKQPLQNWLEDVKAGTSSRRVAALWAIQTRAATTFPTERVPMLAENLTHRDPIVRSQAATTLDALGETATSAVPELISALEDRQGSVRMMAALALGKMTNRAEDVVPALLPMLGDRNIHVANAAAWSLGQFGYQAESAGSGLVKLLRRGILHCQHDTLEDILDAILKVSSHPEELIMECLLEKDAETCQRALNLLKERQIDEAASKAETR